MDSHPAEIQAGIKPTGCSNSLMLYTEYLEVMYSGTDNNHYRKFLCALLRRFWEDFLFYVLIF